MRVTTTGWMVINFLVQLNRVKLVKLVSPEASSTIMDFLLPHWSKNDLAPRAPYMVAFDFPTINVSATNPSAMIERRVMGANPIAATHHDQRWIDKPYNSIYQAYIE
jgi:hypothetical protein